MNLFESKSECEFAQFFKKLGYTYSWDFSVSEGLCWHELYKDGKLMMQAEMDIPIHKIVFEILTDPKDETPLEFFLAVSAESLPILRNDFSQLIETL